MIKVDVLINGGGMVGASIALALLEKTPWKIALLEKTPPPAVYDLTQAPDLRVSALNLASRDWLNKIGAWQHITQTRMQPYTRLSVWEDAAVPSWLGADKVNATRFLAQEINQPLLGYFVENNLTQWGIWQQLMLHIRSGRCILPFNQGRNKEPFVGAYVTDLITNNHQQIDVLVSDVNNTHSELVRAKLAVVADGAGSKLRDMAGIERTQAVYSQQAFAIGVELDEPAGDETWQAFRPQGPLALLPMMSIGQQHFALLIWYQDQATIESLARLSLSELKQEIQRTYPAQLPTLKQVYAKAAFPLAKTHAKQYAKQRLVLAGDAAHTINPLAGQGVNIGFKDAKAISDVLIEMAKTATQLTHFSEVQQALRAYERTRRKQNYLMMNTMDLFYYGFCNHNRGLKLARNLALAAANRSGILKHKVLAQAVGY